MFKKFINFIKNHELLSVFVLLSIVVLISYGRTINMYWWVDDWGLLFKMVHPNLSFESFDYDIWGTESYRFVTTPFIYLFPMFGTDARPYFILGLFQYLLASCVVYLFVRELTDNKRLSLGASVIFASGYIGSFALYRLSNSFQLSDTTIMIYLSGYFLLRYLKGKDGRKYYINYILSLIIYIAAIYFTFQRAHGIIAVTSGLFIFYTFKDWRKQKKLVVRRIIELFSFLFLYIYFYFLQFRGSGSVGTIASSSLGQLIDEVFVKKNFYLTNNLIYSFSGAFVPNPWIHDIFAFAKKYITFVAEYFVNDKPWIIFTGGVFLLASLTLPLFEKHKKYLIYLPLASLFVLGGILTYFVYLPTSMLESTSRYLMPSFVGTALFYSCLFLAFSEKLKSKMFFWGFVVLLSVSFVRLSYRWQDEILHFISYPARQAREVIKSTIPKVDEKTTVFIDAEDDPHVKNNVLGGMSSLAISIFHDYDRRSYVIRDYDELCGQVLAEEISLPSLYTFFASEKLGFVSTTDEFKNLLYQKLPSKSISGWEDKGNYIETEVDFPSLMPTKLNLTISLKPSSKKTVSFVPINVSWLTQRSRDFVPKYSEKIYVITDGRPRNYTIVIPSGGLTVQGLRIDGYSSNELEVLDASIINLTIPEVAAEDNLDCE